MKYMLLFLVALVLIFWALPKEDTLAYKLTKKLEERQRMINSLQPSVITVKELPPIKETINE
jgi:hypothetical protein